MACLGYGAYFCHRGLRMAVTGVRFLTILSLLSEKIQIKMSSQLSGVPFLKKMARAIEHYVFNNRAN